MTTPDPALSLRVLLALIDADPALAIAYAQTIPDPAPADLVKLVRSWGLDPAALPADPETRYLIEEAHAWLASQ